MPNDHIGDDTLTLEITSQIHLTTHLICLFVFRYLPQSPRLFSLPQH